MDIGRVDSIATQGQSPLHRVRPGAKLVAFALVLLAVIVSVNLLVVVGVLLALIGVALFMRLPIRTMIVLSAYPGLFAALFALAASSPLLVGALVVAKAVTAASAAVLLVFTTPYPQIFAPLQRVLPGIMGDILLMTYRSLFLLLEKFGHMLTAARLRAGLVTRNPMRSARVVSQSLGGVLLYSIDLSQRTYDVMHLRGYEGHLTVAPHGEKRIGLTIAVPALASIIALTALLWRLRPALAPLAWMPLAAGALVLLAGSLTHLVPAQETS